MDPVAALNLSRAFEDRLLAAPAAAGRVPAVVISGFLGSGKTTVVRSLLRSRGNLRFAVIMNEFAGVDVDSALLGGASANAAVGLPLLSLPDGCCCCSGSAALRDALQQVLRSASGSVDAMLLETTGLANPAPLADALAKGGAALACVATVVDAEAARAQLAGPAAATLHAQVRCADLVVLNKCDLVDLATLSEVEDALALLTSARIVRCRHGGVPLAALLDVQLAPQLPDAAADQLGGVVSHEAGGSAAPRYVLGAAPTCGVKRPREAPDATPHVLELERISSVVWRADAAPLCAAAFASWLQRAARHSKGLLRAKGTLFLAQRRRKRFVFHLSGVRRVEVTEHELWAGPPESTVVLIGTSRAELLSLRDELDGLASADSSAEAAAGALQALLAAEARVCVCEPNACDAHAKDLGGSVDFALRGMPLKGVDEAVLNAKLMQRVNSAAEAFLLFGVALPHAPDRIARLRIVLAGAEDVAATHGRLMHHIAAVLRDALAQIGMCDC